MEPSLYVDGVEAYHFLKEGGALSLYVHGDKIAMTITLQENNLIFVNENFSIMFDPQEKKIEIERQESESLQETGDITEIGQQVMSDEESQNVEDFLADND